MQKIFLFLILGTFSTQALCALTVSERVREAERNIEGKTFQAIGTMTVKRASEERTMKMRIWWKEQKYALIKVLEPKKDQGTGNLKIKMDLWQYLPKINRIVRVPSSMMLQSWMGSDFSNDDLVKGGSLFRDYTHKQLAEEKIGSDKAIKIECMPKSDAPVVWGKVHLWVRSSDNAPLKHEFYTERGALVKILEGSQIKKFGTHSVPTKMVMKNLKKKDSETIIEYEQDTIKFDEAIPDSMFTQENLRKKI